MNEMEMLRAELETQKTIIVALLGLQPNQQLLRVALQRSLDCHDASWPYSASLTDDQIDYSRKYITSLIERLPA